jgi:3-phosphoshikimate 1-carboxyvinyltransferase
MALPELIELVPLAHPVRAEISVPGSKSITNRALVLGALGAGETTLRGALWSEDTRVMVEALQTLGFAVRVTPDPEEASNRTVSIGGLEGAIPTAGTQQKPLELYVGNAGTAARFLAPLVCLGRGVYRLSGVARMHERPQAALFSALRQLGYRIDAANERLPALIHGTGPHKGFCEVSLNESSQFASGLLLCAKAGQWQVKVTGENAEESPYVAMTGKLIEQFSRRPASFQIEPDASSGSYFHGASWLLNRVADTVAMSARGQSFACRDTSEITVRHWPGTGWQVDAEFPAVLDQLAAAEGAGDSPLQISRRDDLGDSIMTAAVLAPFMTRSVRLTDLGRLRVQETERVAALRAELTRCGAEVMEEGEMLTIYPSSHRLHGADIETYNDHRMAMCFAILGLKVPGIRLKNPACVKKTFPDFFQKLAGAPPRGLGATIREGVSGRVLAGNDLFAD